ncbi:T9SS type A sorting domain-containing protein [Psychroserpens mesophilus]|uniref:T9SS type A sorting domain-containing protein n=1 Tax=Psychroserpens mesophilus TaxID=325473 RepID=UPI003F496E80
MKKLYFLMVAILVTSLSFGQDLIITGTYDGPLTGGTPKGVELYVVNNIPDLSVYGIGSANNGQGTDGEEFTLPAESATAGDFIYISTEEPNFTAFFGFAPNYTDGSMAINGDDAVELFQNGNVIDTFGDINVDGNGTPWEYLDGWAYRVDGTGPDGMTFQLASWTFSGADATDGCTTNASCGSVFPIGTYSPTMNTDPTINITSPNNGQALDSGTASVDVEWTIANAPGATVNISVTTNGGAPVTTNGVTSPFTISPTADGDTFSVSVELVNGGVLDTDMVDFSISFPCDLQVGTITATCDAITPGTDTYNVTLEYTGGATTNYTIDTGGVGTVGGDNPTTVADGTITITGITEGTDFTVSFDGNPVNSSCSFTRNINSPDCDPSLALPLYEGFNYTAGTQLIDASNWSNISDSTDEVLIGGPGGLTYTNLAGSNQTGNHITFDGGGSDPAIEFTAVTSGTLYASFLINVTDNSLATSAGYFALLGSFDARLWYVPVLPPSAQGGAGQYQIGISNGNTIPSGGSLDPTILTTGSTVLVVMSYDTTSGVMNAWVNPSDATFGGSAPAANATDTDGSPQTSLNQFAIRQDSTGETPFVLFDELRIGTSWAEVTPTTLSVNEFTADTFKVYPNPTSLGYVNIASANSAAISVTVFDVLGKQILNETLNNNRLNVSTLNSGVYIMKVTQNNASVTKKLIIK